MPHQGKLRIKDNHLDAQGGKGREQLLLLAHLDDVWHQLGVAGAAELLGLDRKTLWRAKRSGRVDGVLCKALLRHAAMEGEGRDATSLERLEALEATVQKLIETVSQAMERLTRLEEEWKAGSIERQSLATRLGEMEGLLSVLTPHPGELVQGIAQARRVPGTTSGGEGAILAPQTAGERESAGAGVSPEVVKLRTEGDQARAARDAATKRMDQVVASERVLEAELALIQTHGLTLPPGEEWNRVRRFDEISWRWHALEQVQAERQRLQRRRWLRRLLTLGLWWR